MRAEHTTKTRILIVEDELIISERMRRALEILGYEVLPFVVSREGALGTAGELL